MRSAELRISELECTTIRLARDEIFYARNPADKRHTHLAVFSVVLKAIRSVPHCRRSRFVGCEVWRALDWIPDGEKLRVDLSGHDSLAEKLNAVLASGITEFPRGVLNLREVRHNRCARCMPPLSAMSQRRIADGRPFFRHACRRPIGRCCIFWRACRGVGRGRSQKDRSSCSTRRPPRWRRFAATIRRGCRHSACPVSRISIRFGAHAMLGCVAPIDADFWGRDMHSYV